MMKRLLYAATFLLLASSAVAQYKWDYGLSIGGANYLGDIGGKELTRRDFVVDMHLNQTNIALGAFARYRVNKRFALAGNFTYLQINDADSETTNPARRARNLNFRNRMLEVGLRGELTVFYDNDVGGRGYYNPDFKLYVFAGVSGFRSNPQGQIRYSQDASLVSDTWYNLRDFKTEGQTDPYGLYGLAIPAGVGMFFTFDKVWRIGWELSWRTTFTDYLDDVSTQYGDPSLMSVEAAAFSSQSNAELIAEINDPSSGAVESHQYVGAVNGEDVYTKRGDATNNDSYLTSQFSIGRVIRGQSQFYRAKYSWLKNRSGARRSRAKF